jgi:hypothetical protein
MTRYQQSITREKIEDLIIELTDEWGAVTKQSIINNCMNRLEKVPHKAVVSVLKSICSRQVLDLTKRECKIFYQRR